MSHSATPCTARALDRYFELRVKEVELKEEVEIDPRLTSIVERMLDRCAHMGSMRMGDNKGIVAL